MQKYIYLPLTARITSKKNVKKTPLTAQEIRHLKARYRTLASRLGSFESLSQGSVMSQPPSAWIWTRKVSGKTVTRGLSAGKAEEMKQAIANHRALEQIIAELREITQKLILEAPEKVPVLKHENHPKRPLT